MSLFERARSLDDTDPLRGFRERFAIPKTATRDDVAYFCGNSLGLMPKTARTLVNEELDDWERLAVDGHFEGRRPWYRYHEAFRPLAARLLGAEPGEVVMMNSLTTNLHLLLAALYRPRGERRCLVIEDSAFPSDRYVAQSQAQWHGLDPNDAVLLLAPRPGEVVQRTEDVEAFFEREGARVSVLLLSAVNFVTGQLYDLPRITEVAHRHGAIVVLDLAHAAGNVPLALHDWGVDGAAFCSYKYLNGGPGAAAGFFLHERHGVRRDLNRLAGWWGNDPATRFSMPSTFTPVAGAEGFQLSNAPVLSLAPVLASMQLFDEAGMQALRTKSLALTGFLEESLAALGDAAPALLTPREPAARGAQLSLRVPGDARWFRDALQEHDVVCDFRPPDVIRVAPVPLYNSFHDVARFVTAYAAVFDRAVTAGLR